MDPALSWSLTIITIGIGCFALGWFSGFSARLARDLWRDSG